MKRSTRTLPELDQLCQFFDNIFFIQHIFLARISKEQKSCTTKSILCEMVFRSRIQYRMNLNIFFYELDTPTQLSKDTQLANWNLSVNGMGQCNKTLRFYLICLHTTDNEQTASWFHGQHVTEKKSTRFNKKVQEWVSFIDSISRCSETIDQYER